MRGDEALQWIRNQCEIHGHNFVANYGNDGTVEVRVNDTFVLGFYRWEIPNFDPVHIERAYEVAALPPIQEAQRMQRLDENNGVHNWGQLPDLDGRFVYNPPLPDAEDGRFAFEGVWHDDDDEYARQVLPVPEVDPNGRVFFVDDGEGGDVWAESKIKSLKDREGEVAYVWSDGVQAITASALGTGTSVPMNYGYQVNEYGQIIGSTSIRVVSCKMKKHYVAEGVEFCEQCCWTCQAAAESPFCTTCRKTMRAEEKEAESVRSFASKHFPSLVPFLD
jgi:hypothetical protein